MTLRIHLVNMPFATLYLPSIALTQLKAAAEREFGSRVSVRINYLNHEFARRLGAKMYDAIAQGAAGHTSGFGEWLFRGVAFPDQPDNTAAYLARYKYQLDRGGLQFRESELRAFRAGLPELLDEMIQRYRIHEADLVGMTSMFFQNLPSIALANRLRGISPRQLIVLGGANCEAPMGIELVNNVPIIDYVFSGMSLISFPKFIGHVLEGRPEQCDRIDGVFSRRNSKSAASIVSDPAQVEWGTFKPERLLEGVAAIGTEQDINQLSDLDYDSFLHSLAHLLPEQVGQARIPFETSRGCWWGERAHCTFCGLNGGTMAYRSMHPDRAVALLNGLFARYAEHANEFESVDNILPREYFESVFPRLSVPDKVSMFYEVKADLLEEQVRVLAQAHVYRIQPGIEALATSTLKLMRKGTTAFHGLRLLSNCKKHGVTPVWNLLVGFPGETIDIFENYVQLLPSLFHLQPPIGVFQVRFDRFSPYFFREREYGLQLVPYDYYALCYPFPAVALRNMAYYFQDMNHEARYAADLATALPEMRRLTTSWQRLWYSGRQPPALGLTSRSDGVYLEDTRPTSPRQTLLTGAELDLLGKLSTPTREDELPDHERALLAGLHRDQIVFQERGRYLSLVTGSA